jgi:hypothetical protein
MKLAIAALATIFMASPAFSYSLDCASADSNIQYHFDKSDGGAPRPPSEKLRFAGQDIINATFPGRATFRIGKIEFGKKHIAVSSKKSGDYVTTQYAVTSSVSATDGSALGADYVICTEVVYKGAPRP